MVSCLAGLFGRFFFLLRLVLFWTFIFFCGLAGRKLGQKGGKSQENCIFTRLDVFFTFSVLHCHGVSLSGSPVFVAWLAASWSKKVEVSFEQPPQQQHEQQQQEEKVANIIIFDLFQKVH